MEVGRDYWDSGDQHVLNLGQHQEEIHVVMGLHWMGKNSGFSLECIFLNLGCFVNFLIFIHFFHNIINAKGIK